MAVVEITDVSLSKLRSDQLWGRHIELPKPGHQIDGHTIEIAGWVLSRGDPVVAVEVLHEGSVVRRVPITIRRPDVAATYPQATGAEQSGFLASVLVPASARLELLVQVVLQDESRVQLGVIRAQRRWHEADYNAGVALVSVVIPCYNQARFLSEAIESVLAQTYPHVEIVVVDDGSSDNTAQVAARYASVHYLRQNNQGLSAARNAGVRHSSGSYLVFLDADDRLLPTALEAGLTCLKTHLACAFVAGHYREISFDGSLLREAQPHGVRDDYYAALLQRNFIVMHATVMYQRILFEAAGGFDTDLKACEDYDLYLRIARKFPIYCYDQLVAEYRRHGTNMTGNAALMFISILAVLSRQWKYVKRESKRYRAAYKTGLKFGQEYYGAQVVEEVNMHLQAREWQQTLREMGMLLRYYRPGLASFIAVLFGRARGGIVPREPRHTTVRKMPPPAAEQVRFGSLRRVTPISRVFGFDRGQPIDRYYIERFLADHAHDIRGRVLEIGDNVYTRRFGGSRVTISDVLHIVEGNPKATFVGDLTCADHIPSDTFDCVILTQTLQFIYDVRAAIGTLYRILKSGGVLLATVPGISQKSQDEWSKNWCWGFSALSVQRLFKETFPAAQVNVQAHGNVLASIAFLHGLAVEELHQEELDFHDPDYELLITVSAVKLETAHDLRLSQDQRPAAAEGNFLPKHPTTHDSMRSADGRGALILLYHRIAELPSDPWALSVTPGHFAEHLEVLRKHANPISLRQLVGALHDGNLPQRSVVVTFDDGYADNLYSAKPLLEHYDIPATIFVTTGSIGHEREFWWDDLERLLLQPGTLPEVLRLSVNGRNHQWELGEAAHYHEDTWRGHRYWRAWEAAPSLRHVLYRSLWEVLQPLSFDERRKVLDELLVWAGAEPIGRSTHRSLSFEEIAVMAQGELIEVGAHTVTHPVLSSLSGEAQRHEIQRSKAGLEAILGHPVTSFAYPHGGRSDYTAEAIAIVQESGFICACATDNGVVGRSADCFQLPRVHVSDWDGTEFARQLSIWFNSR